MFMERGRDRTSIRYPFNSVNQVDGEPVFQVIFADQTPEN